ncbi:MAG: hypothetical protein EOO74_00985 [Myxococcales bacterium]|nr:MAG: hypothetical protein EOO74_00985 [Myxococcales bacterium]
MAHQEEDPKNLLIVTVGLGSVVVLAGVMFGLYSYYLNIRDEWQHIRVAERTNPELIAMRTEDARKLGSYAYNDAAKTQVRIPVDQAMKLLAQRGRDAFPSIQPAGSATGATGAAPTASGATSATPPGATSATPAGSGAVPGDKAPGDKKDKK